MRDKAFKIASSPEYDGYQRGSASIVLIKSLQVVVFTKLANNSAIKSISTQQQLADELHKPIMKTIFGV